MGFIPQHLCPILLTHSWTSRWSLWASVKFSLWFQGLGMVGHSRLRSGCLRPSLLQPAPECLLTSATQSLSPRRLHHAQPEPLPAPSQLGPRFPTNSSSFSVFPEGASPKHPQNSAIATKENNQGGEIQEQVPGITSGSYRCQPIALASTNY